MTCLEIAYTRTSGKYFWIWFEKRYPVLSDLPISFKNASNFVNCKTFDIDKD